ncbi:MAG TPA: Ada metal-binding domain-containing protein [Holophagaceae bacterium]|nr:Ada metal-binding domain-containing protein [Holophagaceae bacterium]
MKLALLALMGTLAFAQAPAKKAAPAPAPKAAPAPAPKAAPVAGGFIGNKDSKIVHKADCKTAAKMKAENKVTFGSMAEAEKAGYKACKVCKP